MSTWADNRIGEYTIGKKDLLAYRQTLDTDNLHQAIESDIVGEMISDMHFALEWIRSGRRPGSRRGADQRGVYQRTELATMFPSIVPDVTELTIEDKHKILDILIGLSSRERQCFLLYMTQDLTYAEIGARLKVSRGTVQSYVKRAQAKVQQGV